MVNLVNRAVSFIYFTGLPTLLLTGGGLFYLNRYETLAPGEEWSPQSLQAVCCAILGVVVAGAAAWLARLGRRRFLLGNLVLLLVLPLALALGEGLARFSVPPWPAIGLNGVQPLSDRALLGRYPEIERESAERGVGLNGWGLRDVERTLIPAPGVRRIGFVGDSYLEEVTPIPVSLLTERKLRGATAQPVEILNLGVTASGPEEYFYRTKHIGLPLGIQHCVLFVYAANDLQVPPRTLAGLGGIVAVYPRGSLFSALGLRGLNHLLTNRYRSVFQSRANQPARFAADRQLHAALVQAHDAGAAEILLSLIRLPPLQAMYLAERLRGPDMSPLYDMLRHPDRGLFQPNYLKLALQNQKLPPISSTNAEFWIRKTVDLCRQRGIKFSLVLIPEGCQVDARMNAQWSLLADIRQITAPFRTESQKLCETLRGDGVEVLDLHDALQDVPGTYLNLDGHFSDKGVEVVSEAVAEMLLKP